MSNRHKHADLIHKWCEGAEIERLNIETGKWLHEKHPVWFDSDCYRLRPEEKKPVVRWLWANKNGQVSAFMLTEDQDRASFNIKLEWSRTEFPE